MPDHSSSPSSVRSKRLLSGVLATLVLGGLPFGSVAAADEVLLDSGARLEGTVLKRNDAKLWLDIGPDVQPELRVVALEHRPFETGTAVEENLVRGGDGAEGKSPEHQSREHPGEEPLRADAGRR